MGKETKTMNVNASPFTPSSALGLAKQPCFNVTVGVAVSFPSPTKQDTSQTTTLTTADSDCSSNTSVSRQSMEAPLWTTEDRDFSNELKHASSITDEPIVLNPTQLKREGGPTLVERAEKAFPGIRPAAEAPPAVPYKRPGPSRPPPLPSQKSADIFSPEQLEAFKVKVMAARTMFILARYDIDDETWQKAQDECPIYSAKPEVLEQEGYCVSARRARKERQREARPDFAIARASERKNRGFFSESKRAVTAERVGGVAAGTWSERMRSIANTDEVEKMKMKFTATFNKMTYQNAGKLTIQGVVRSMVSYFTPRASLDDLYTIVANSWFAAGMSQRQHCSLYGRVAHWLCSVFPKLEVMLLQGVRKYKEEDLLRQKSLQMLQEAGSSDNASSEHLLNENALEALPDRRVPTHIAHTDQIQRLNSLVEGLKSVKTCDDRHCIDGEHCIGCINKGIRRAGAEVKAVFREVELHSQFRNCIILKCEEMYSTLLAHNCVNHDNLSESENAELQERYNQSRITFISSLCQLALRRLVPYKIIKTVLVDCIVSDERGKKQIDMRATGLIVSGLKSIIQVVEEISHKSTDKRIGEVRFVQNHFRSMLELLKEAKERQESTTKSEEYHQTHWAYEMVAIHLEKWLEGKVEHSGVCIYCERKEISEHLYGVHGVTRVECLTDIVKPKRRILLDVEDMEEGGPSRNC